MSKFTRTTEDFTCQNCGLYVRGTGYTNHCPRCLYSQHVDIYPGDRLNPCKGTMKPISLEAKNSQVSLIHKCETCGVVRKNKVARDDNFDVILTLSQKPSVI